MSWDFPLVAFDLDGTLASGPEFVWSLLHGHFAVDQPRRRRAREDYLARRISYAGWFATDLELLQARAASRQAMLEAFAGAITPTPGAVEVLEELQRQGRRVAVISGSVDLLLEHLFPGYPFVQVLINRLHFDEAGLLVGGEATDYDMERKAVGLALLAEQHGLDVSRCAFVGDHLNDLEALRLAGRGIAFSPRSPLVAAAADVVLPGPDLRPLLDHLT